ncbi:MAG: hypothetical protein J0L62_03030 [Bacteroidetes bacterium]|nr:hypothetical protein [Bacteroidota bacterium]
MNSLSNRLTIQELYDRKYTQKRLQELGKGSDDLYDPTFAKQFGKSIGVDALIVGTYNIKQVSKTCRLIIKVIDVETGRINATSNTEFFIDNENLSKARTEVKSSNFRTKDTGVSDIIMRGCDEMWYSTKPEIGIRGLALKDLGDQLKITIYITSYEINGEYEGFISFSDGFRYSSIDGILYPKTGNLPSKDMYLKCELVNDILNVRIGANKTELNDLTRFLPFSRNQTQLNNDFSGTWVWSLSDLPNNGSWEITYDPIKKTYDGFFNDKYENTLNDRITDIYVDDFGFRFKRIGKYGIQFYEGKITKNAISKKIVITNGKWKKEGNNTWSGFTARQL